MVALRGSGSRGDSPSPNAPGAIGGGGTLERTPALPAPALPLPALLALATRVVTESVHQGLAAAGFADIRPAHGYAFSLIAVRGGATGVEIAAHLGITRQSAKVLIDALEAGGYVTRERVAWDRRARVVALTDRAWACIEAGTRLWALAEAELCAMVGSDAVATTRRTLDQLAGTHSRPDAVPLRPPR